MVKIIAEIGINHNGSLELCKKLMMLAKVSGCNYAKIQKRNPDVCVPEIQKNKPKDTPWGKMTYLEYKKRIEFNEDEIKELFSFAGTIGINLFASVWDIDSVNLMKKYTKIAKLGSASINDLELCKAAREAFEYLIISTGMSTEEEVINCIKVCNPDVVMHTNSTYPCPVEELNLNYINHLKKLSKKFNNFEVGYSGHEYGLVTTFAAVSMGSQWIERHVTLNRNMWGSDQKSSIEPSGLFKLVKGIRDIEEATKYPESERVLFEGEKSKRESLRKTNLNNKNTI
jgi:N-acetylneuraminate synthase